MSFIHFFYRIHGMKKDQPSILFADNKKAHFDYEIIEEYEAGIRLVGEEVKSIRSGGTNLKWSYILITSGRPVVTGMHIGHYNLRNTAAKILDPKRDRELLMQKKQILKLAIKIKEMGATLVPMQVYSKWNLIKIRVALVKWKKAWQKKESIKEKDLDREIARKFRL